MLAYAGRRAAQMLPTLALCVLAVPALKQISTTSCPWDLAEFGGVARYASHWALGVRHEAGTAC